MKTGLPTITFDYTYFGLSKYTFNYIDGMNNLEEIFHQLKAMSFGWALEL